jgi:hypothetical protein
MVTLRPGPGPDRCPIGGRNGDERELEKRLAFTCSLDRRREKIFNDFNAG